MRILLVTQFFHPENFKSNDIAFEMADRGHDVTVLTGLPNYPGGKVYDGYGVFKKRVETVNGVRILRTLVIPRGNGSGLRLALNYCSWAFIASIWAFFMGLFRKYDAVIVHETSPITQGFPALIVKWMQRIPMYFWVLDLWPESLQAAGNIKNRHILDFFSKIAALMYRNSEKILIASQGFRNSILDKGDFVDKLVYFPNWAEDVFADALLMSVPQMPEGFIVMFAGNVGEAQDFENVMKSALLLKDTDVKMVIIGEGRKKPWADQFIDENQLHDVVYMMGRYPLELMPSFFNAADVMFLSLKEEDIFSLTIPAKLQAYMASGKPVAAMINGEARKLIQEADCGVSCPSGDPEAFADCIRSLRDMPSTKLEELGSNGKRYFDKYFKKEKCMDALCNLLEECYDKR